MEEQTTNQVVVMTPGLLRLKVNTELAKNKLTIPDLEARALAMVKNRDSLKAASDLRTDINKVRKIAKDIHATAKKPFLEGSRACDEGNRLVAGELDRIESMFGPWYDNELAAIDEEQRQQKLKKERDADIIQGIEANIINFSNRIVAATTKKALNDVESLINLEKSPSRANKYGEFHAQAIEQYDTVLIPIIKDQKIKVDELEKLTKQLLEAEAHNDPDRMDEIDAKINEKSNEILQNNALVEEAALNSESFPVATATEVLPEFKVKRTNYSFEIADLEVALKKSRELLDITVNNKAAREVLEKLKDEKAFEGKDEVVVNGIKYIATRVREAL